MALGNERRAGCLGGLTVGDSEQRGPGQGETWASGSRGKEGVVPKLKIAKGLLLFIQESEGRCLCWLPAGEENLEYQRKVWDNNL